VSPDLHGAPTHSPTEAPAQSTVLSPSHYLERVEAGTGEILAEDILPEELLVSSHRDGHPVDISTRALMGWLIDHTGREELVHAAMRDVRKLGYKTADAIATLLKLRGSDGVAAKLFGIKHPEHFFRFKGNGLHRAEVHRRQARLKEEVAKKLAASSSSGKPRLRVLLTGGTGFVGKEVIWQAAFNDAIEELIVLLRPRRVRLEDGSERVISATERGAGLLEQLWLTGTERARKFRFVQGDILEPGLGLEPTERERLAATATHVVHCAASVAFDSPYDEAFRANVLGSRNAILLSEELFRSGGPFCAHIAIETSYIHGRQQKQHVATEEAVVFPRNFYNNYYELTKAFASIETEQHMLEHGLPVIQLCPSIVVGDAQTGNNRGDLKVVNAPVNVFGRAGEALNNPDARPTEQVRAFLITRLARVFPGAPGAELNLVSVDRVAAGILAALQRPEAVGERIHLATDDRITAKRIREIVEEELDLKVRLAEPTLHRNITLPVLTRVLKQFDQGKLAQGLEKLAGIFGSYSEWGQPVHEVGSDVDLLGLPAKRPSTDASFRMLCRHNKYVQRFGRLRDPEEISRRERTWARFLSRLEHRLGRCACELSAQDFQRELEAGFDLDRFEPRREGRELPPLEGGARRKNFSPADAAWLHMDHPTNLMQITGVITFDAPLDLERLKDAVAHVLGRYDRFRMRVVDPGVGPPHWEADKNFSLSRHIEFEDIEPGEPALRKRVGELMATPLDRQRPLWHFLVLDRAGEGSALVARIHHSVGDGIALMRVLLSMTEPPPGRPDPWALPALSPQPEAPKTKTAGGVREWAGRLLHTGQKLLLHPGRLVDLATGPSRIAGELGHLAALAADTPTPLKGPLGVPKVVAWSDLIPLARVKAVKRHVQGTVNDVLMATLTGALRRYLVTKGQSVEGLEVRAVVPVDLRQPGDPNLGNRFGLVFLALPLGLETAAERLAEIKRRMDALKRSPEAVVVFGLLSTVGILPEAVESPIVDYFGTKASAVVTNVPGPREVRYLAGLPVRDILFWVPQSGRLGLGVSILSYAGSVRVGIAADAGLIPDPAAIGLAFNESFRELEAVSSAGALR
jgi:WS/DGAT/MGAT family acyltransferase